MLKLLPITLTLGLTAGCATSIADFNNGINNFPEPKVELPIETYPLFGLLNAQFNICYPSHLNNAQGLRSYYYVNPKPWGYKHSRDKLNQFIKGYSDYVLTYSSSEVQTICHNLKELAWDKGVSETIKGLNTINAITNIASMPESLNTFKNLGLSDAFINQVALMDITSIQNSISISTSGFPQLPEGSIKK
jgi:hypothetical protein